MQTDKLHLTRELAEIRETAEKSKINRRGLFLEEKCANLSIKRDFIGNKAKFKRIVTKYRDFLRFDFVYQTEENSIDSLLDEIYRLCEVIESQSFKLTNQEESKNEEEKGKETLFYNFASNFFKGLAVKLAKQQGEAAEREMNRIIEEIDKIDLYSSKFLEDLDVVERTLEVRMERISQLTGITEQEEKKKSYSKFLA